MFRMWGKVICDRHLIRDHVFESPQNDTRTHLVFKGLEEICYILDIEKPIWLDTNIADFKKVSKTRFTKDSFIESIDFDYLEIQIIEE